MYQVNEIFYSLQGEGYHTGRAAVFVRLAGCNLRCPFCDTDFVHGEPMTAGQIAERVFGYSTDADTLIVLTGGEPTLQVDEPLVEALHRYGQTIAIETNGTHPVAGGVDWITVSPKAGAAVVLSRADELKLVMTGQSENEIQHWLTAVEARHHYLQPCWQPQNTPASNVEAVVSYILAHPEWRLSLQTHKYIHIQ